MMIRSKDSLKMMILSLLKVKKIDCLLEMFGVCDTLKNTTLRHCHWTRKYGLPFFQLLKWTVEDAPFALKIKNNLKRCCLFVCYKAWHLITTRCLTWRLNCNRLTGGWTRFHYTVQNHTCSTISRIYNCMASIYWTAVKCSALKHYFHTTVTLIYLVHY